MSKKQMFVKAFLYAAAAVAVSVPQVIAQTIKISSYDELRLIGRATTHLMSGNYELTKDIDASASRSETKTQGFTFPLGDYGSDSANRFTGTFNGNGYKIKGLYINRPDNNYIGLFGAIGQGAEIRDLNVEADSIIGKNDVGIIAGYAFGTGITITNCAVKGTVKGVNNVGGLFGRGQSTGRISASEFVGAVSGDSCVGGIKGGGSVHISGSKVNGTVSGVYMVGGVAGENYVSNINNSHSVGTVTGIVNVGGLIGWNQGVTRGPANVDSSSYSTATVKGDTAVGGLIGYAGNVAPISSSYSTGDVSGKYYVGGLIGYSITSITKCYATGAVSGIELSTNSSYLGGLVGFHKKGAISESYAIGNVSGGNTSLLYVGGLVGVNDSGSIIKSYAAGTVDAYVYGGGLVGQNTYGIITDCYSVGDVVGSYTNIGGLVSYSYNGKIERCYSVGAVNWKNTVSPGTYRGGLVGYSYQDTISSSVWDIDAAGIDSLSGYTNSAIFNSVGKRTSDMKNHNQFTTLGWDFTNVWAFDGSHYPYLRAHPIQKLTYTAGTNGTINGSVKQTVNRGAAQVVAAVPNSGYFFVSWSDGVTTAGRIDRFLASDSISVTARFGHQFTLKYRGGENGSLMGDTSQVVLEGNSGTAVGAVTESGYTFIEWSDGVKTAIRTDINVSKDIDVYAIFGKADVGVKYPYSKNANLPLVTVSAKTLNINAASNSAVHVRLVNLRGRTVANFKSVGSASYSLRAIPSGAYIVEARREGYRMTKPITVR